MADPEQYRTKEEVAHWRERDPIPAFAARLERDGVIDGSEYERIDTEAIARGDAAVEFADASPYPAAETLYDDVYVLPRSGTGELDVRGWYSMQTTDPNAVVHPPGAASTAAAPAANDEIPQQLTNALAAGEDGRESAAAVNPESGGTSGAGE